MRKYIAALDLCGISALVVIVSPYHMHTHTHKLIHNNNMHAH